jgi:flagellar biosynthetic protein FliR
MGFVSFIIVRAVIAAGDIMGMQMGLSSANLFDPSQGVQTNVVSRLLNQAALLFFLVVNGHIMIFAALEKSFHLIPVYTAINFSASMPHLIDLGLTMWELAVRFAAPVILAIFLLDFAFGTISRVAPQVNVFMLGFQIKPSLGLFTLYLMMPLLVWRIVDVMQTILSRVIDLLGYMMLPT